MGNPGAGRCHAGRGVALNLNPPRTMQHPQTSFRTNPGWWPAARLSMPILVASAVLAGAPSPSITTDHFSYLPGEDIVASFKNGPGNPKDWIGVYPKDTTPGTGSTRWHYVDGTDAGNTALTEGSVVFAGGLDLAGDWTAHILVDDGYTTVAQSDFRVVDPTMPFVRPVQRVYTLGEPITVAFTNGPANPADWIGIYKAGEVPGGPVSTLWSYVGGTQTAGEGKADGTVSFPTGLAQTGDYEVFFLENDGYTVLASEPFSVVPPSGGKARVLRVSPADGALNVPPQVEYAASLTNEATSVVVDSVKLSLDGAQVSHSLAAAGTSVLVTYTNTALLAAETTHVFELTFSDNGTPAATTTNTVTFTVGKYSNLVLPAPLYFESFDATPEGQLPTGWTEKSYTDIQNSDFDLGNLDSASYATWVVVSADRFKGKFVAYSNPDGPVAYQEDYHRVLSINPLNVVNGQVLKEPLAKGNFVFSDSGYRNGASQVMYLFTPDFNLAGKQDIYLSFHSLWEQNQDSIAAVEYSIDQGNTWLPIAYWLAQSDVLLDGEGNVDAVATFTTDYPPGFEGVARYIDPDSGEEKGGTYGTFIGAPVSAALAPYINPRVDDDPVESKRVELFRLPQADNQAKVRFRFAHAGTDSWYFGVDDFGLYSIPAVSEPVRIGAATISGGKVSFSWTGGQGPFQVYRSASLNPASWQKVGDATSDRSFTETVSGGSAFYYVTGN